MNEQDKKTLESYGFKQEYENDRYTLYIAQKDEYAAELTVYKIAPVAVDTYYCTLFNEGQRFRTEWDINLESIITYMRNETDGKIGKKKRKVVDLDELSKLIHGFQSHFDNGYFIKKVENVAFEIEE